MKITKIGHCCLLIEENGVRILTDPGSFTTEQNQLQSIDIVLITHEHADHLHIDSLKTILANSPEAQVISNTAVEPLLAAEAIACTVMSDAEAKQVKEVAIEAYEAPHALLHSTLSQVLNTGFFIANTLFYPGDSYINPQKPVDVLALPVAGPWAKTSEVTDYALAVKPKRCFPVHDAVLKITGANYKIPEMVLGKEGIEFFVPENNVAFEA